MDKYDPNRIELLNINSLTVEYRIDAGWMRALDGISLELERGAQLGLVGESGCGKSTLGLSILGLLPENARVVGGEIFLNGRNLVGLSENEMRKIRAKHVSLIAQGAIDGLDPVFRVGDQIAEALTAHFDLPKGEVQKRVSELFREVGLSPERIKNYPHQLSGGMRQRVMICMGLICNPELLIADEPTTALDVVTQDLVMGDIEKLRGKFGFAAILISHDIPLVFERCSRIAVMYAGKVVEYGSTLDLTEDPRHPYTRLLLQALPSFTGSASKIVPIPGRPPRLFGDSQTCAFLPRCPYSEEICKREYPSRKERRGGYYLCHI
jgi:peptide/nickel transport system ATP-binding protein